MKRYILAIVLTLGFIIPQHVSAVIVPTTTEPGIQIETYYAEPITELKVEPLQPINYVSFQTAPQGTYPNTYAFGNCTAYVASRKNVPNSWGNANTWAARAAAEGYTVSNTPIPGTIGASTAGAFGHVVIVDGVSGDQVFVSEMNVKGLNQVDQAWYPISKFVYIYM